MATTRTRSARKPCRQSRLPELGLGSVALLLVGFITVLLVFEDRIAFALARAAVPVTHAEADRNHDGEVSYWEADELVEAGKRPARRGATICTEYYSLKDGLPLKVACP